jgi:hypothetical protein
MGEKEKREEQNSLHYKYMTLIKGGIVFFLNFGKHWGTSEPRVLT